jgi:hypothetical protein
MEGLNTIILAGGTIIVPALVFFVNSQMRDQIASLELRLGEKFEAHRARLEQYMKEQHEVQMESQLRSANLDKRLAIVESGHESISVRLDALVRALDRRDLRDDQREHHISGGD